MIRVLVADDQPLVRGGILMLLADHPDIEVVGEAAAGDEALELALQLRPDIVLMDLRMPGLDGVEATRRLTADDEMVIRSDAALGSVNVDVVVKVLVLTTFNDDESVYSALTAGASGFVVKDAAPRYLVEALRTVAAGDSWLDPSVAAQVIRALGNVLRSGPPPALLARLTNREREVLGLMARGLTNGDIRERLFLSEATVKTHVSRILTKTGSRDRSQAVVLAYQSGLVRVGGLA